MRGFTAIEIVFMIFILIVVVLVVIQLVSRYVSPKQINPYIENFQELAKSEYMRQFCDTLCSRVKTATSEVEKLTAAAQWCMSKIVEKGRNYIDIIEDGITGFYVVGGYPYCEAGTYCFHFFSCDAGTGFVLDEKECQRILCEYYLEKEGDTQKASDAIRKVVDWGNCRVIRDQLQGRTLLRDSANWWHVRLFGTNEDFCSIVVQGGEFFGGNDGGGGGGGGTGGTSQIEFYDENLNRLDPNSLTYDEFESKVKYAGFELGTPDQDEGCDVYTTGPAATCASGATNPIAGYLKKIYGDDGEALGSQFGCEAYLGKYVFGSEEISKNSQVCYCSCEI